MRSVFSTGTAKTASIAAIAGFLAAITPNIAGIIERAYPSRKADIDDIEQIAIQLFGIAGLLGGGLAIANRASAVDKVYGPTWLPGFNQSDLVAEDEKAAFEKNATIAQVASLSRRAKEAEAGQLEATRAIAEVLTKASVPPVAIASALIEQLTPDDLI
jgi:hypothetical protein